MSIRMVRSLLVLLLLQGVIFSAAAKENKDSLKAGYYYEHYAYNEAIPYFERIADELKNPVVYARLADCYNITGDPQKAAAAYAKAVRIRGCSRDVALRYGQLLMQLTQYAEAEKWLKEYQKAHKADKRLANLISACHDAPKLLQAIPQGIASLLPINSDGSDFAPALWQGRLVYASDTVIDVKKKTDRGTGKAYYNLYSVSCSDNGACGADIVKVTAAKDVNIKYHTGPATFSADGREMYFTRSSYQRSLLGRKALANKDSTVVLQAMIATGWDTAAKKFSSIKPFQYNNENYAVAHPSVSPGGQLLAFSSNMPKGYGRSDIYFCRKINGEWSAPQSAGSAINTEGEEQFPYWADDSTLFFSSDGHVGLGGLDIYKCSWNEAKSTFSAPENIGAPINSSYDDISLALYADGRSSWFSSNRPAAKGGDNIYFYKKQALYVCISVYDSVSRKPLADVRISRHADQDSGDTVTNKEGKYFVRLYPGLQYTFSIDKNGCAGSEFQLQAVSEHDIDTFVREVYLSCPKKDTVATIAPVLPVARHQNIMDTLGIKTFKVNEVYEVGHFYYDFNKYELKEADRRFLDTLLGQLVRNPHMRIEVRSHTDCRGSASFNKVLSNNRALSVVNYLVAHGISRRRLEYIGLGNTMPYVQCPDCSSCTDEQHYLNRVLEFRVLAL